MTSYYKKEQPQPVKSNGSPKGKKEH